MPTYLPNSSGGDAWFGIESSDLVSPPNALVMDSETDFTPADEDTVSTDDGTTVATSGAFSGYRFQSTPGESAATVTQLDFVAKALAVGPAFSGVTAALFVWDANAGAYELLDSISLSGTSQTLSASITTNLANYFNASNEVFWLLHADGGGAKGTFDVSYTELDVTAVATAPEMDVSGNGQSIADGDATPSADDHTDFGQAEENSTTVDRTFAISNTGDAALTLDGDPKVALSGAGAAAFSVTSQPSSPVAADGSTTFTIRFEPTSAATFNATVSIDNDDSDEDPYTFAVTGEGTEAAGGGDSGALLTQHMDHWRRRIANEVD